MRYCDAPGCNNKHYANGWCSKHRMRMKRHGTLENINSNPRTSTPKYKAVHRRIMISKGKASEYLCIACGDPAQDWALIEERVKELVYCEDEGWPYSYDINDYEPMCKSHHKRMDMMK